MSYPFPPHLRDRPLQLRMTMVFGSFGIVVAAMYVLGRRSSPGKARVPLAIFTFLWGFVVPLVFNPDHEIVAMGVTVLISTWLLGFKAIGWALGRGPLSEDLSFWQFIAVALLPITPVLRKPEVRRENAGRSRQVRSRREYVRVSDGMQMVLLCSRACIHDDDAHAREEGGENYSSKVGGLLVGFL